MSEASKDSVIKEIIAEDGSGQRVDNFLFKRLKGVPKSHVYRILRSGEVRVNKKRINADFRLNSGDEIRIPPVRIGGKEEKRILPPLDIDILFEDDCVLALNKPAGVAVHGGSGISFGVIEQIRFMRPDAKFLELVHRLDRDTSGVLLLAKKRAALVELHRQIREGLVEKHYRAIVKGKWRNPKQDVKLPLKKYLSASGERRVCVDEEGLPSRTVFALLQSWPDYSLLDANLKTGRTHQIRVHLCHLGFPILGDEKYGDFSLNRELPKMGLKRMALHAFSIVFSHPTSHEKVEISAPLATELQRFIDRIS